MGEIFKVIFRKKWLFLAIALAITVAGTLIINFGVNKSQIVYESEFDLSYPGIENGVYPDGTPFDYRDIVSLPRLTAVKASDAKYEKVDVSAMAEKNDITLTRNTRTENSVEVATGTYTVSVKGKYFENMSIATDFITDLTSYPVQYAVSSTNNFDYTFNLTSFSSALSYADKLNYLSAQESLLTSGYGNLISSYGEMFSATDDKGSSRLLRDYLSEISLYFNNNRIDVLYTELETNGYISDDSYLGTVRLEITELTREKEDNENIIANLKTELAELVAIYGNNASSIVSTYESFNSRIAALTERNVVIDRELKILRTYLGEETPTAGGGDLEAFHAKLDALHAKLTEFTATYSAVTRSVYNAVSRVNYTNVSIVTSTGSISLMISIIGSLVVGFILACIVNLIIDMPGYLRKKKADAAKREQDSEEEQN